jgi:AcrR family transcriptional regulator
MNTKSSKIISRRARPAKAPLSVDAILSAALDLLAREGLEGLSLRKVAAALDTGPASLYVYVDNFNSLLALMLDRALAKVAAPSRAKGDWRGRLSALLHSYLKVLMSMPGLGQLALTTMSAGPNSLRGLEAVLGLLREGGIDDARAAWAADMLSLQVVAIAAEQDAHRRQANPLDSFEQALGEITAQTHPNIHALREKLLLGTPRERIRWAIDVLINGILHTPITDNKR